MNNFSAFNYTNDYGQQHGIAKARNLYNFSKIPFLLTKLDLMLQSKSRTQKIPQTV